jgi:hypothetical protein
MINTADIFAYHLPEVLEIFATLSGSRKRFKSFAWIFSLYYVTLKIDTHSHDSMK